MCFPNCISWYQSFGFQMALREENYVFFRRIADRGNDKIMFDSQDRKIQETDSRDVIWDEIVGKEEHPEFYDGYKFLETDSEAFIRDENCGKEEYSGNCSVIYLSPPCFDEYEDEEWYSWFTGGYRNLPGDESGYKSFVVDGIVAVENGGIAVAPAGKVMADDVDTVVHGTLVTPVALDGSPTFKATTLDWVKLPCPLLKELGLNNAPIFTEIEKNIQIVYNITVAKIKGDVTGKATDAIFSFIASQITDELNVSWVKEIKDMASLYFNSKIKIINVIEVDHINVDKPTEKMEYFSLSNIMWENKRFMVGHILGNCLDTPLAPGCGLHDMSQVIYREPKEKQKHSEALHLNGPNKDSHVNKQMGVGQNNLSDLIEEPQMGGSVYESLIKEKHFYVSFDPGGTSLESSETTHEVGLFKQVVLEVQKNRVDIPFDPGGFGPKAKLGDEFFRRRGV